ncbi:MAG: phosphoglycerate dehydrogenase [Candidatus Aerophobus sp.]|nr:MAG: phosphoglycerate dehydrogenase [Candidatus Aerophobus sp.]
MKVLISDPLAREGADRLKEEDNIKVREAPGLSQEELIRTIPEYDALIVRSETKVTGEVIGAASRLKVIGRAGTGLDNIDITSATKRGIIVMNTPGGNTISAAEHTISMMLALSRNIPQAHFSLKSGEWNRKKFMGTEVYGKILGMVGLGRIGSEVAKRAQGLKMRTIAYDPFISKERAEQLGVTLMDLEDLLPEVDYLTVHTPLSSQTRNLIGEREIALMKKDARIINCARGGIIQEDALYQALKENRLKGAALDVFEKGKPFDSPLLKLDSVIFTPHLGASTKEAQKRVALDVVLQVIDVLKGGPLRNAVNILTTSAQLQKKIEPYLSLAEKMGDLEAQLAEGHPKEVMITYGGQFGGLELEPITVALLKGLLNSVYDTVNYVNAPVLAKERGIKLVEIKTPHEAGFTNLVSLKLITDIEERRIDGTVFERVPHIVRIDDYPLDFVPQGNLLICANVDKPGAVGRIATTLGRYQVNIGSLQMGRRNPGRKNVSVYGLDSSPSPEALRDLLKIKEVLEAKLVHL